MWQFKTEKCIYAMNVQDNQLLRNKVDFHFDIGEPSIGVLSSIYWIHCTNVAWYFTLILHANNTEARQQGSLLYW